MAVWSARIAAVLCIWAAVASLVAGDNGPREDPGNFVFWDFSQEDPGNTVEITPLLGEITPLLARTDRWHLVPKVDHVKPPYSSVARLLMLGSSTGVDDDPNSSCTGTFITHNLILTCAHCFFVPDTDRRYEEGWVYPGAYKYEMLPFGPYKYTAARGIMHPNYIHDVDIVDLENDIALIYLDSQVSRSAVKGDSIEGVVTQFKPTQLTVTKTDNVIYYDPIMWSYPNESDTQSDGTEVGPIEVTAMHESDGGDVQTYLYVNFVTGGNANRARWAQTNLNAVAGTSGAGVVVLTGDASEDVTDESYAVKAVLFGTTDANNRAVPLDCPLMKWIWEQILANDLSRVPDEEFEGTVPCHEEDEDGCVTWIGQCDPPEDVDISPPGGDDDSPE